MTTPEVKPVSVTGGLQTDYVIKTDNDVSFESIILPEYNAGGFGKIPTGSTVYTNSSTADMVLNLVVDYDNCQELVKEPREETTMDITITFTLQSKAKEFFNDTLLEIKSLGAVGTGGATERIKEKLVGGERVGYTIELKGYDLGSLTTDGKITLTVLFNAGENASNIDDCLNGNTLILNTSVYSYKQEIKDTL